MAPHAAQAGVEVLVLGQAHLQAALLGGGVQGEDVEDQGGSVDNLDRLAQELFQVGLLAGGELVVEDHEVDVEALHQGGELVCLARPDEGARVGGLHALADRAHDLGASGVHQALELGEALLEGPVKVPPVDAHEHSALGLLFGGLHLKLTVRH